MCRNLSDTVGDAIYISRMPWECGTLSPARDGEWGQLSGRPRLPAYLKPKPCSAHRIALISPSGLNIIIGEMIVNTPLNSAAVRCLGLYSKFYAFRTLIVHVVVYRLCYKQFCLHPGALTYVLLCCYIVLNDFHF